jgi:hypothetical protein
LIKEHRGVVAVQRFQRCPLYPFGEWIHSEDDVCGTGYIWSWGNNIGDGVHSPYLEWFHPFFSWV